MSKLKRLKNYTKSNSLTPVWRPSQLKPDDISYTRQKTLIWVVLEKDHSYPEPFICQFLQII